MNDSIMRELICTDCGAIGALFGGDENLICHSCVKNMYYKITADVFFEKGIIDMVGKIEMYRKAGIYCEPC